MHRNTYLLVTLLAVFAALLVGVNVGKKLGVQPGAVLPTPTASVNPPVSPTPKLALYSDPYCGISLNYPDSFTKLASATGGAMLVDTVNTKNSIAVACQEDIPRPALPAENIETVRIGTISGMLYHDTSPKDGTPIDSLIFTHPKTGLDVFLAGYGTIFTQILTTLNLL